MRHHRLVIGHCFKPLCVEVVFNTTVGNKNRLEDKKVYKFVVSSFSEPFKRFIKIMFCIDLHKCFLTNGRKKKVPVKKNSGLWRPDGTVG